MLRHLCWRTPHQTIAVVQPASSLLCHAGSPFSFSAIAHKNVHKQLRGLSLWKAAGSEEICHRGLKECADSLAIADSLCFLFNLSLKECILPEPWKTATVQQVYKQKGDR